MAKIARRAPLKGLPAQGPQCPAALMIGGAVTARAGIVCRVIQQDREREKGLDVSAGAFATQREGGDGDVFLTVAQDPSSVERLCCGTELPVADDGGQHARAHYTFCPVWQAEKLRIAEQREMLAGGGVAAEPESVAHFDDGRGNVRSAPEGSSYASPDPWAQARRDLDVLAPREA